MSPDLNLGDITKVDETKLEPFTMICGGSPCQDFSNAGKQKGSKWKCKKCGHEYNPLTVHWDKRDCCPECGSEELDKTRSSLLVEWLRIIRANKPNFGIYENVKNIVGKQFRETTFKLFEEELREYGYNTYWKVLNAKNYGIPQNRERVYLILIKKELDNGKFKFPDEIHNGIQLKDLLEDYVDEKYYISEDRLNIILNNIGVNKINDGGLIGSSQKHASIKNDGISTSLISAKGMGGGQTPMIVNKSVKIKQATKQGYIECKVGGVADLSYPESKTRRGRVQDDGNTCPTITATETGVCYIEPIKCVVCDECEHRSETCLCDISEDKEYCPLTEKHVMSKSEFGRMGKQAVETFNKNQPRYGSTINPFNKTVDNSNNSPTLTTRPEGFKTAILPITYDYRIRKLTPKECFRLMGFTEEDFYKAKNAGLSDAQLYKQAGNSIVVEVLHRILVELYIAMPYLFEDLTLSSYFSGIGAFEKALDLLYEDINIENFIDPSAE